MLDATTAGIKTAFDDRNGCRHGAVLGSVMAKQLHVGRAFSVGHVKVGGFEATASYGLPSSYGLSSHPVTSDREQHEGCTQ